MHGDTFSSLSFPSFCRLQATRRNCNGRPTLSRSVQLFHGRPGNQSHQHSPKHVTENKVIPTTLFLSHVRRYIVSYRIVIIKLTLLCASGPVTGRAR